MLPEKLFDLCISSQKLNPNADQKKLFLIVNSMPWHDYAVSLVVIDLDGRQLDDQRGPPRSESMTFFF